MRNWNQQGTKWLSKLHSNKENKLFAPKGGVQYLAWVTGEVGMRMRSSHGVQCHGESIGEVGFIRNGEGVDVNNNNNINMEE